MKTTQCNGSNLTNFNLSVLDKLLCQPTECLQNLCINYEFCPNDNCAQLTAHIQTLERKIALLETQIEIFELHDKLERTRAQYETTSVGVQVDTSAPNPTYEIEAESDKVDQVFLDESISTQAVPDNEIVVDGDVPAPQSFLLVNTNGSIEAPSSVFSPVSPCGSESSDIQLAPLTRTNSDISLKLQQDASTKPAELHSGLPFAHLSVKRIIDGVKFTHDFGSRKAVYFGAYPYPYNGGYHEEKTITSSYLTSVCHQIEDIFPSYEFNSVLVHLYESGHDGIPLHSDNEKCIVEDSYILTLSLGATRTVQYSRVGNGEVVQELSLPHGSVTIMSKASQSVYQHQIKPDTSCSQPRISLTFRLIKPSDRAPPQKALAKPIAPHNPSRPKNPGGADTTASVSSTVHNVHPSRKEAVSTIYVSSSMFRHLDPRKLSSKNQRAEVFYYPGANSHQMLQRLTHDPKFIALDKKSITKVFVMTATNNVDAVCSNKMSIEEVFEDMNQLCCTLWQIFPHAKFHLINLLPRVDPTRNAVINDINTFLYNLCLRHGLTFVDTECQNHLFYDSKSGLRKSCYFGAGYDNVHLNAKGIARLGRHLKYVAHY